MTQTKASVDHATQALRLIEKALACLLSAVVANYAVAYFSDVMHLVGHPYYSESLVLGTAVLAVVGMASVLARRLWLFAAIASVLLVGIVFAPMYFGGAKLEPTYAYVLMAIAALPLINAVLLGGFLRVLRFATSDRRTPGPALE